MSPADVASTTDALMRLGASTAEAVAKSLDAICPSPVERGDVTVVPGDESPFDGFPFDDGPAVAVSVHYVDGVTGGNVLLMTARAARAIAAAMGGDAVAAPPPSDAVPADAPAADAPTADTTPPDAPTADTPPVPDAPTELELSAVAEAANQMFAAAASATGVVLSQGVEIAPPDTRLLDSAVAAREAFDATPHAVSATFVVCGEPCRLVQLVPNAFVVRMTRALDEQGTEQLSGDGGLSALGIARRTEPGEERALDDALRDIRVRVWAELGRTRVSLGAAPELPPGAVLELDRKADDPVDLYVNGLRFASGRLVLTDEGEWALRLEEVAGRTEPALVAAVPDSNEEE
ncbi:MAG TPA: FliM/FliN family flagellar motor switch protein [Conexibacter sp.]|jgi:flagellar motor switch protein FliN/FliY|nr:FliM/FliN family flagellar motor switch protein [Conexibacter sp.]